MIRYFVYNGNSGLRNHPNRDYYSSAALPRHLQSIDIWHTFKIQLPQPNAFYPPAQTRIQCTPPTAQQGGIYSTVLIDMDQELLVSDIRRYRVGEIRFVFTLSESQDRNGCERFNLGPLFAYVHWFSPISKPSVSSRFRTVKKEVYRDIPDGGIVPLSNIVVPCPLAPVLPGRLQKGSIRSATCMETELEFYINPFASHIDYELYA
ncbi:uncharacterized protein EI90DRAFT_3073852 [Cantharellus anzutake]|uniref:uncharacterized protein n=1 Tax=Cantharellus anzutake TaxID=1750568 RepID=UPI00190791CB|nr:uncharacterized protein EI90DRAFT_3073852 [Cantharellus anzutake]KAF8325084.1 hypothetical protein EI90DRAFT_3073852 [Cantharellus anzutake]